MFIWLILFISWSIFQFGSVHANDQFGETCLSVKEIKSGKFRGFMPLNNLDDEPATPEELAEFVKTVTHPTGAEWSDSYDFGFARCNYASEIEISLSKMIAKPPKGKNWVWDGSVARCHSTSVRDCRF